MSSSCDVLRRRPGATVFLAYPSSRRSFALSVRTVLEARGHHVTMYMPPGWSDPVSQVSGLLDGALALVVVLPPEVNSDWVRAEAEYARLVGVPIMRVDRRNDVSKAVEALEEAIEPLGPRRPLIGALKPTDLMLAYDGLVLACFALAILPTTVAWVYVTYGGEALAWAGPLSWLLTFVVTIAFSMWKHRRAGTLFEQGDGGLGRLRNLRNLQRSFGRNVPKELATSFRYQHLDRARSGQFVYPKTTAEAHQDWLDKLLIFVFVMPIGGLFLVCHRLGTLIRGK